MRKSQQIRFVGREDLDPKRWDSCIEQSSCSLIYAHSFWLDTMAVRWDGLVLNDYEAVMPLTWNRKWGISYLFQPPFTQQLGLFGSREDLENLSASFLKECEKRFRFAEIFLNFGMPSPGLVPKTNYILDLHKSYDQLCRGYKEYLQRDLKQLAKKRLQYRTGGDFQEIIEQFIALYSPRVPHLQGKDYRAFRSLCTAAQEQKMLLVRKVYDETNHLLALGLFFKDRKRIYHVMSVTPRDGRRSQANIFLMDELIREFAGSGLLLDFEGSDLPGVAWFYRKFGGQNQPYSFYRFNHLPPPLRWIKRSID